MHGCGQAPNPTTTHPKGLSTAVHRNASPNPPKATTSCRCAQPPRTSPIAAQQGQLAVAGTFTHVMTGLDRRTLFRAGGAAAAAGVLPVTGVAHADHADHAGPVPR
ncbi:hypothetical protein [Actinophytocola sp.]|uniref:hypothetical protein n=1 Tax=Actinophytocola sp. TaxID=1872138 RepID=UPI002D808D77|nr:hypothetical protein [Actinophytocola sp.]HET9139432.1 hypothetical protein [Actinophytocola sp.]